MKKLRALALLCAAAAWCLAADKDRPTLSSCSKPSASHCWEADTVAALNDQINPTGSNDHGIPRFTWLDHRGTEEWAQYDFAAPAKVSSVEVVLVR